MPLIGTAGHVDHGKSTLIEALTGRDPDRWAEEKRRGLTIDLGFAWADLGEGVVASFVDVPGHERYLKNMLAGIEAIDIALFVVAANEGWKPQSEEHLAALDLLDVRRGVVALTKTDLVDEDAVELAMLEVEEQLSGTSLAGAKIIPVSAPSGKGLDNLKGELIRLSEEVPSPTGRPRLWVDRVFSVPGAGTVVTGSLLGGSLTLGEQVSLYPGDQVRIRSIQSHEEAVEVALPGRRVALGLAGVEVGEVERGAMIGASGQWSMSDRFGASLDTARYLDDFPERGAFQIHIGTGAQNVTIEARSGRTAIVRLDRPVALAMGDRFIIRETGRRLVVAGGQVLDPRPGPRRVAVANLGTLTLHAEATSNADELLAIRGIDSVENLRRDSNGGDPTTGTEVAGYFITPDRLSEYQERVAGLVAREHADKPLNAGISLATLATRLSIPPAFVEEVVRREPGLEMRGPDVAARDHRPSLTNELGEIWETARSRLGAGLDVPLVSDLGLNAETLHLLIRNGELVRITETLVYLPHQIDEIIARVGQLKPPFSVGDFKDAVGLSRKYAMPILEWLDSNHYTSRRGDRRVFGSALPAGDR